MSTIIKVTVGNRYLPNLIEEFFCLDADITDLDEVEYCADECCGEYLDMHADAIYAICPDANSESIAEACFYSIEEVMPDELDF